MASSSLDRYPPTEGSDLLTSVTSRPSGPNNKLRQRQKVTNKSLLSDGDNASSLPAERLSTRSRKSSGSTESDGRKRASHLTLNTTAQHKGPSSNRMETIGNTFWNPLQTLASTVLGSNIAALDTSSNKTVNGRGSKRKQAEARTGERRNSLINSNTLIGSSDWGPDPGSGTTDISKVIHEAARGRMREALLSTRNYTNGKGHYKRKTSPSPGASESRSSAHGDILVYVHNVKPTDTIAGVVLMYNIEPSVLRKANRLWPNDSIQMRSKLFLPADQCLVKGLPAPPEKVAEFEAMVTSPTEVHCSLSETHHKTRRKSSDRIVSTISITEDPFMSPKSPTTPTDPHPEKPTWEHHAFVLIEPMGVVEIGRLPQPKLSYFPPPQHRHAGAAVIAHAEVPDLISDLGIGQTISDIAKESLEGLEVVGSAIETFVRRMTVKAGSLITNEVDDTIELTNGELLNGSSPDRGRRKDLRPRDVRSGKFRDNNL